MTPAEILSDPGTFATSSIILLTDEFGTEFVEWDPVTLNMEIVNAFGIEPSGELLDRINAGTSLFTSNLFQLSLEAFSAICNSLNFGSVTSELFLPADLDDVLWGVTEAYILGGDMIDKEGFSHNIARYVGYLLSQEGLQEAPSVVSWAEFDEHESNRAYDETTTDPAMYKAYWERQEIERTSLEKWNNEKIVALFKQIEALPLKNGNASFVGEVIGRMKQPKTEASAAVSQ